MKKYVAFNIVKGTKFYLKNNSIWEKDYKNVRIYLENEVDYYLNNRKRKYELKTKYSLMLVEEYNPNI